MGVDDDEVPMIQVKFETKQEMPERVVTKQESHKSSYSNTNSQHVTTVTEKVITKSSHVEYTDNSNTHISYENSQH